MMHDYQQELAQIKDLLKENPEGMSVTDIAKALKKNKNTTGRYLDILLISGQVDMRTYGMAKVFTLSQRVPLSAMLSCSKDMIMVLDSDSRIIEINDMFLELLHIGRKEATGKNIAYLKSPDVDVHELVNALAVRSSEETERTLSFMVKGVGERIFKQKSIPTVFDDGAKGFTLILTDVTGDILREREIREWEERFRMMAENIRDALLIIENDKCTFVNRSLAEITGYTFEELWAMDLRAIIAPEDQSKMEPFFSHNKKSVPGPALADLQCKILRKDGVYRDVFIRVTSARHGEILYHFVILTDVTELRTKDAALVASEQRFRMMADNIQDAVVIIENDQFVYANRRVCEMSGYTFEELRHKDTTALITPETRLMMDELYRKSIACTEPPAKFQSWMLCKNGEKRCIYGQINSVRHEKTVSTYITMTDVTAFAQREQELREQIAVLEKRLEKA